MYHKIKSLQESMQEKNWDLTFIQDPANIRYFTDFDSEPHERILALIVFEEGDPFLFTPALDAEDAKNTGWPYPIYSYTDSQEPFSIIIESIKKHKKQVDTFAVEDDLISLERFRLLKQGFPEAHSENLTPVIQSLRLIKNNDEIEKLKGAGKTADHALEIGYSLLEEGISEQELVEELEYQLKKQGTPQMSFDTMVLFGDHAANPHGVPSDRQLKVGDFALFDLGTMYEGYASDVTRTFAFGEASAHFKEVYNLVLEANQQAIDAIRPGITAHELDAIAREVIAGAGYGEFFNHRLGHGLGQSIHEYPSIVQGNEMIIQEGMVFSIEPGIYIPGEVGVRIEDCVFVTADGAEVLTHTPKELLSKNY